MVPDPATVILDGFVAGCVYGDLRQEEVVPDCLFAMTSRAVYRSEDFGVKYCELVRP